MFCMISETFTKATLDVSTKLVYNSNLLKDRNFKNVKMDVAK